MNAALFEQLTGKYRNGMPVEAVPRESRLVQSIIDHLDCLFNSRVGMSIGAGDDFYGLPDVSEMCRRLPDGADELATAVQKAVDRYEPRLMNIRVTSGGEGTIPGRIVLFLAARIRESGMSIRLKTTFTSVGRSSITSMKQPG